MGRSVWFSGSRIFYLWQEAANDCSIALWPGVDGISLFHDKLDFNGCGRLHFGRNSLFCSSLIANFKTRSLNKGEMNRKALWADDFHAKNFINSQSQSLRKGLPAAPY